MQKSISSEPPAYLLAIRTGACQLDCITIGMIYAFGRPYLLVKAFGSTVEGVLPIVCGQLVDLAIQGKAGTLNSVCTASHNHSKEGAGACLRAD